MTSSTGLRRDAENNRQRLLGAAREVFGELGLDATLHDVARRAGVGVGTAYRRFANKEQLLDAIHANQVDELDATLTAALQNSDPWAGVVHYLEVALSMQAWDRSIAQFFSGRRLSKDRHDWQGDRLAPMVDALVARAVAEGAVRSDLTGTDLVFLQIGVSSIAEATRKNPDASGRDDVADLYRRYLWLFLDGIRPEAMRDTLPIAPLSTAETHRLLSPTTTTEIVPAETDAP